MNAFLYVRNIFSSYLLTVYYAPASVEVYQRALGIMKTYFGGDNLRVALAYEDLAFATYVNDYSHQLGEWIFIRVSVMTSEYFSLSK